MKSWWRWRLASAPDRTIDERFTDLADSVSEAMGRWRTSAFALVAIIVWALFGPATGYSDSWQLSINTPTTIIELFLGLFTLAAANRVEKRNYELHHSMAKMLEHVERLAEKTVQEETEELKLLREIAKKLDYRPLSSLRNNL